MPHQRNSQSLPSNKKAALIGLGLVILFSSLTQAAWQQTGLSCPAVHLALGTLSSVALDPWQAIHAHPCAQQILVGLLNPSGAVWPLLLNLAGAL